MEEYTKLWEELKSIDFSRAHLKIEEKCAGNYTAYHASFIFNSIQLVFFITRRRINAYSGEWSCRLKQIGEKYCNVEVPSNIADEIETMAEMKREQEWKDKQEKKIFVDYAVELLKKLPHSNDKNLH